MHETQLRMQFLTRRSATSTITFSRLAEKLRGKELRGGGA